jgi:hypothetical protein
MSDIDLLKQELEEVKREVQAMDAWMKVQEPSPGVAYEDWIVKAEQIRRTSTNCSSDGRRASMRLSV